MQERSDRSSRHSDRGPRGRGENGREGRGRTGRSGQSHDKRARWSDRDDRRSDQRGPRREWGDQRRSGEHRRNEEHSGRPRRQDSRGDHRNDRRDDRWNNSDAPRYRDERRGSNNNGERRESYRGRREERRRNGDRRRHDDDRHGQRWKQRGEGDRGNSNSNDRRRRNDDVHGQRRSHAQRGGRNRDHSNTGPNRPGFRDERDSLRHSEPPVPEDLDIHDLDPLVLQDLNVLAKDNRHKVAQHLIMAATWLEEDPKQSLQHARAAKNRAGRVAVVRETLGIVAYHAGEWKEALSELRAARRMSGGPGLIAVMADCERGLGRPEKALELGKNEDLSQLDLDTRRELAIVMAGARSDLQQFDDAVATLESAQPTEDNGSLSAARLSYAYADSLLAVGRQDDARHWFEVADRQDEQGMLDAEDRLQEIGTASEGSNNSDGEERGASS